jgi:hypothetical protein
MLPILITKFERHKELKDQILNLIDDSISESSSHFSDKISKTDYYCQGSNKYWDIIYPHLNYAMKYTMDKIQYDEWEIDGYWFQQYNHSDIHGWHYHPKTFYSNVYYLEKPKDGPGTELVVPLTGEIISPKVEEGEILTFPSIMKHRSPTNISSERKTVIAFNIV